MKAKQYQMYFKAIIWNIFSFACTFAQTCVSSNYVLELYESQIRALGIELYNKQYIS